MILVALQERNYFMYIQEKSWKCYSGIVSKIVTTLNGNNVLPEGAGKLSPLSVTPILEGTNSFPLK